MKYYYRKDGHGVFLCVYYPSTGFSCFRIFDLMSIHFIIEHIILNKEFSPFFFQQAVIFLRTITDICVKGLGGCPNPSLYCCKCDFKVNVSVEFGWMVELTINYIKEIECCRLISAGI